MADSKETEKGDHGLLLALIAFIIGGSLRLYTAFIAGFPINDGGLFYTMVEAIQANGYALPNFIYYNGLEIPFAYPPLGFYLSGLVSDILSIPLIEVFRWLPAVVLAISIPIFYKLAQAFLNSGFEAGIATLIYALLPRSITWLIMGGGVTRSIGQVFLMIAAYSVYKLFSTGERKYLWGSILASSLVCLSHPEAAIHTISIAVLIWLFEGRDRQSGLDASRVAAGTLILTSFWWLPTLLRFGTAPYHSAAQTSLHNPLFAVYFLFLPFSDEPHVTFIIAFAILGIAFSLAQKETFLPLLYFIPFIIEPRNAANVSAIPMAMLASIALNRLIIRGLHWQEHVPPGPRLEDGWRSLAGRLLSIFIFMALFIGMLHFSVQLAAKRVTDENLKAFAWVQTTTPRNSKFLVMTGKQDLFGDWTAEWFPALALRTSVTTIQGREWLGAEAFAEQTTIYQELQTCLYASSPLGCIESRIQDFALYYDYIYIPRKTMSTDLHGRGSELKVELGSSVEYSLVYAANDVVIFKSLKNVR
jgi:hypothetical protein